MTPDEIVSNIKKMCELNKEIKKLHEDRQTEEKALTIVYKVDECNAARNALIVRYQGLINELSIQIRAIEDELGTKIEA